MVHWTPATLPHKWKKGCTTTGKSKKHHRQDKMEHHVRCPLIRQTHEVSDRQPTVSSKQQTAQAKKQKWWQNSGLNNRKERQGSRQERRQNSRTSIYMVTRNKGSKATEREGNKRPGKPKRRLTSAPARWQKSRTRNRNSRESRQQSSEKGKATSTSGMPSRGDTKARKMVEH